jgi:dipeptidyl aminopeptidase/acylaminoacyl peptidase
MIDVRTGAQTPLVVGAGSAFAPRWSADGQRLAYISTAEGRPEIFVRWMTSGATARVAATPESPSHIEWSPDGQSLAFTMLTVADGTPLGSPLVKPDGAKWAAPLKIIDAVTYRADGEGYLKPGYEHLYVVSATGGEPRQLTFGAYQEGDAIAWSADSRSILFSANRTPTAALEPNDANLFRVNVASGDVTQLTRRYGPNQNPQVSPGGDKIAYVGFTDRHRGYENVQLSVMNADGSNARVLAPDLDRSVGSPRWAADGRSVYVQFADHGVGKIARVTLDGHVQQVVSGLSGAELDRPYSGGQFSVARSGVVAYTAGDPTRPGDVAVTSGGPVRRLTDLNQDLFFGKTLAAVTPLKVTSSADHRAIDAWVMTPPGFDPAKKYPLILEIHGGPFASYGPVFASELQLYAAAGYVVVYANPRGSTSYGFEFADTINDNYPSQDYDDLMSVVDAAIAGGSVDKDNLFVTGGSGGGLLTAWIVGKTNRFKAAASQKPVINWTSEVLTTDGYNTMARDWFGVMPWQDQAQYWRRSPLSLVGAVATPTLLMVGEDDHRTPASEAEQFYQALQLRSVPTAMIRVPGASHEGLAARPSQEAAEASAILAWFARYRAPPA